ncbi:uncharacterized protein [Fopius arisanus]|uniref:HMG box domain-containing protein n=1 Tax=Fopius arisanus TaxID=64838 RepID=A0A9R1TR14_9HYME|nr:PREDICTED: uncharacterized protein LOC105273402 [Fopius arisanus]
MELENERNSTRSRSNSRSSDDSARDSVKTSSSVSNVTIFNSPGAVNKTTWKSANAFLNYVQDFRQNLREAKEIMQPSNVIRLAGQQWRAMPEDEKKVYIDGALAIKRSKSKNTTEGRVNRKRVRAKSKTRKQKSTSSLHASVKKKARRKN